VRHVCEGGFQRRTMYLATADYDSSNPSFNSSPWMRAVPHAGLAKLILRIRSRTSRDTTRHRGSGVDFHRQYSRSPCRCQAITDSGLTITSADCQPFHKCESQTHKSRSAIPKRSRWPRLSRWSTMSYWRGPSISASSAARVRNLGRIEENSEKMIVNMALANYTRRRSIQLVQRERSFW